jgi:hypothetical protein
MKANDVCPVHKGPTTARTNALFEPFHHATEPPRVPYPAAAHRWNAALVELERAPDADDDLSEDTKRFIDRRTTPGDKQPAAPSMPRDIEADHASRMGARKTGV